MNIPVENKNLKKILDYMAEGTGGVEKVMVIAEEPEHDSGIYCFDKFISANKGSLHAIYFSMMAIEDSGVEEKKGTQLLARFLQAPKLNDTYLKCDVKGDCTDHAKLPEELRKAIRMRHICFDGQ